MADLFFYSFLILSVSGILFVIWLLFASRFEIARRTETQVNNELVEMYKEVSLNCSGKVSHKCLSIVKVFKERVIKLLSQGKVVSSVDMYNAAYVLNSQPLKFVNGKLDPSGKETCYLAYCLLRNAHKKGLDEAALLSVSVYDRLLLYNSQNSSVNFIENSSSSPDMYFSSAMDSQESVREWIGNMDNSGQNDIAKNPVFSF